MVLTISKNSSTCINVIQATAIRVNFNKANRWSQPFNQNYFSGEEKLVSITWVVPSKDRGMLMSMYCFKYNASDSKNNVRYDTTHITIFDATYILAYLPSDYNREAIFKSFNEHLSNL